MRILVLNPGGNSLKAELVECREGQRYAFEGQTLVSIIIEGIGKKPELARMQGKENVNPEPIAAENYGQAAESLFAWWEKGAQTGELPTLKEVRAVAIRVVHGGHEFDRPALMYAAVTDQIIAYEKLAPLHNKSSVEVLDPVRRYFSRQPGDAVPVYAVFDTAFHRTMPDYASTYALPLEIEQEHQIRRYGFHGISHRYLLERYAHLAGKQPSECNVISMHLESGCSVTAVEGGRSVDNTMGMTPLEGLMMGTRSGDIDPAVIALLMKEEQMTVDEVMTLLNKKSGLLGVSGVSLDTRVLMKQFETNPRVQLAMKIFAYRVRKAVGAYAAALGEVHAVLFGGGIAENNVFLREQVCAGMQGFGLVMDAEANARLIDLEGQLSTANSRVQAWVIPTEEGKQMAHECLLEMAQ